MSSKRLYRDRENGKVLGVCAGLGEYFGIDRNLVRVAWIIFIFTSYFLGIVAYFALGLLLDDKPQALPANSLMDKRPEAIQARLETLSLEMAGLEQALTRLEAYVTSDAFILQRKIRRIGD
jgi:phage shock protein C